MFNKRQFDYKLLPFYNLEGWKLPTGGTNGQLNGLMAKANIYTYLSGNDTTLLQQGSTKTQALPYNFHYAGRVNNGSLNYETTNGNWWSQTSYSANNAYYMRVTSSDVNPANANNRCYGFSLRCITTPTS